MRILHVTHQYPPDYIGGVELYTQTVAHAQAALGHSVAVFTHDSATHAGARAQPGWVEGEIVIQAVQGAPTSANQRFMATFAPGTTPRALDQLLERFQPDIVHIQHLMGLPAALVGMIQRRHIPFVVTLHDYWWICANAQLITNDSARICDGPDAIWFNCTRCAMARAGAPAPTATAPAAAPLLAPLLAHRGRLLRKVLQQAERLITPTRFVADWHQAHGVSPDRMVVLPLGVERPAADGESKRQLQGPVRFAYIGGLTWQKGIHVLLQAFQNVQGNAELWIGGDPQVDPAYAGILHKLAGPNVRFLGQLDRQQVWQTLAQADLIVAPSLWYESFSLLVHEAFAAGVPVLASRLGALSEVVDDGVNGISVPPGNIEAWQTAMQQIVDAPQQLSQLRAGIRPPLTNSEHGAVDGDL